MPEAVAYIRRSVSRANDVGDLSREFQSTEVLKLANGDAPRIIDSDWGRSAATDKTFRRLAFLGLMESVERGEVSALYAYSADRLARSIEWSSRLWNACARSGTAIVTTSRRFEPYADDEAGWAIWHYEALSNEQALRGMVAKARATAATRKRRGDYIGQVPYGFRLVKVEGVIRLERDPDRPVEPILDAVRRSGGRIRAAVRILNEDLQLPTAYGKKWDRSSLVRLVEREAPELRPIKAPSGRREAPPTPALFAKLLRCHCGATLTPNRQTERRRSVPTVSVNYYCHRGNADRTDHPRVYVSERKLLDWIRDEARFDLDFDEVTMIEADQLRVAELREDRRRQGVIYGNRGLTDEEYEATIKAIDAALEDLDDRARSEPMPEAIDWEHDSVERINRTLRGLFRFVQLDHELRPVEALWWNPALRCRA